MTLNRMMAGFISAWTLILTACGGGGLEGGDYSSNAPASPEPTYYGKPTDMDAAQSVTVTLPAKFLYRGLSFTPGSSTNGLTSVVSAANAIPIAFAEFHIYDSSGTRIQQGETNTNGIASFMIPKTTGTYTFKVFSRAYNDYLKVSVLADIYSNTPHYAEKSFTITAGDITAGTKDLTSAPVYAEANESISSRVEGGAFNIMYDILLANEYIRRNIGKNNGGTPSTDTNVWWVADKVTVFWKAGFNPYSYFGSNSPLSFYSPGDRKLYILGGVNGDVKSSDTDHFDDSVILHEYGHFLEDVYGNSGSPGGSHTGNFVIDARLAWSEGWANYFQAAVLSGADAAFNNADENRAPTDPRYHYYVDTYGYRASGNTAGVSISFNLWQDGTAASYDNTASDLAGTGTFREVSVSRALYKATRKDDTQYEATKYGGGVSFTNIWKTFAGEDTSGHKKGTPLTSSLVNTTTYPVPSVGLFNYLLSVNIGGATAKWDAILSEEKQTKTTKDYAYYLGSTTCSDVTFTVGAPEIKMSSRDPVTRSNQQVNNDFYLLYHSGGSGTLSLEYTSSTVGPSSEPLNLDLVLYKKDYVYFEDAYWKAGYSSEYVAKQSRQTASQATESVSLNGLSAGFYIVNVKIDAYEKAEYKLKSTATYRLKKDGVVICGTER
ncbi:hypothetical protein ACNH6C_03190 [Bdellovibrio bacteriovorus]|uniref:hypothetical protein n=1 Tax=Bdellovibrio bacteriovorus TaxID=959 RepID=UPI003A8037B1